MNSNNKKWYVGAMNDGLFVIDAPPRPSTDDVTDQPGVSVIVAMGTNREAADLLVAEHNGRIAAREAVFTEIGIELRRYGANIRKVDLMARFQELFREGNNTDD